VAPDKELNKTAGKESNVAPGKESNDAPGKESNVKELNGVPNEEPDDETYEKNSIRDFLNSQMMMDKIKSLSDVDPDTVIYILFNLEFYLAIYKNPLNEKSD